LVVVGPPETRYATSPDGFHIAYQTLGLGPPDILLLNGLTCVDAMWEDHMFAHALHRLARLGRLICFDWRGQGGSDSVPLGAPPTLDSWSEDVRTVLDATGSTTTTLIGQGPASSIAVFLAATGTCQGF
jgi:pimeloyl-ACP methyl ester carboxylesterase